MNNSPLLYTVLAVLIVVLAAGRAHLHRGRRWERTFRILAGLEVGLIAAMLAAMIFLGCLQIVLRNFFHSGILWADLVMRHLVLWMGGLGAALATTRVRHINIDVFSRVLPGPARPIRRILVYAATAAAAFVLGVASLRLVADERLFGEVAVGPVKTWMLQTVLPWAFFVIAYRCVVNLFTGREPAQDGTGHETDPVPEGDGAGEAV